MLKPYSQHIRETALLSLPVIGGQLGLVAMGQADSMMIGHLGPVYLSAANLANSIYFIITIVAIGATFALAPVISEALGAEKPEEAGHYLRQGFWVGALISVITGTLAWFAADLLPYMQQPPEDVVLAQSFLRVLACSTPFMIIYCVYKQYTDGLSLTLVGMFITILGLVINVAINYILIEGRWGFPRMELTGAGVGTLIGRICMAAVFMVYVHWAPRFKPMGGQSGSWKPDWGLIGKLLKLGLPIGFQFFFEVAAFAGTSLMIGWLPNADIPRSAHQIAMGVASMTFMVVMGVASGASIRVGNYKGSGDLQNLRRAGISGLMMGTAFMMVATILILIFRHQIPGFYNVDEPEVLAITAQILLIVCAFEILDGLQGVASGLLRGMQDVEFPTYITFVAYWLVSLPLSYYFTFNMGWGVYGVWMAFVVSLMVAATALTWRFFYLVRHSKPEKHVLSEE